MRVNRLERQQVSLYLVMGSINCQRDPEEVLREALEGGVTCFQYREKGRGSLKGEAALALGRRLKEVCRRYQVPFLVDDDLEMALALEADGLHVGQEDLSADEVRRKLGEGKILGVSARTVQEAEQAIRDGADYLGVGPMFPTATKEDVKPVVGPQAIALMRGGLPLTIPVVGIGGINVQNAAKVMAAGADGVAVISAICQNPDPFIAACELSEKVRGG